MPELSKLERSTPFKVGVATAYLLLNTSLNMLNRWALGQYRFRFPMLLNAAHQAFGSTVLFPFMMHSESYHGTHAANWRKYWKAFLFIGAVNGPQIALNNASLVSIELSLNQVIRAGIPVCVACFAFCLERHVPTEIGLSYLLLVTLSVMCVVFTGREQGELFGVAMCGSSVLMQSAQMSLSGKLMSGKARASRRAIATRALTPITAAEALHAVCCMCSARLLPAQLLHRANCCCSSACHGGAHAAGVVGAGALRDTQASGHGRHLARWLLPRAIVQRCPDASSAHLLIGRHCSAWKLPDSPSDLCFSPSLGRASDVGVRVLSATSLSYLLPARLTQARCARACTRATQYIGCVNTIVGAAAYGLHPKVFGTPVSRQLPKSMHAEIEEVRKEALAERAGEDEERNGLATPTKDPDREEEEEV